MKTQTAKEMLELEPEMPVLCARGILKTIYDHKTGPTKDGGTYSLQNGYFSDSTGDIKFCCSGRKALDPFLKGREVVLECIKSQKGGFTGVKIKEETYQGKTKKVLWITGSAKMEVVTAPASGGNGHHPEVQAPADQDGGSDQDDRPEYNEAQNYQGDVESGPAPATARAPAPTPRQNRPPAPVTRPAPPMRPPVNQDVQQSAPRNGDDGEPASPDYILRKKQLEYANLYLQCMVSAEYVRDTWNAKHDENKQMTDAHFQVLCSSLFIQSTDSKHAGLEHLAQKEAYKFRETIRKSVNNHQ
jgi:hypothetical protein